ncbi:MAG: NAD(P)/FAD-dependent oxidoreductase [Treponema sp.]|nr:NAD(P)/FAD-dependent oxidoreductase [Treponema sp.]
MKDFDVVIIGGGAVGCATAYVLSRYDLRIALLERNPDVAMGTSGKNSAVVHAGFNNKPGSLMAGLCVAGNKRFEGICGTLDVPYKKTGKLVIGFNDEDMGIVDRIVADGARNGSVGLRRVDRAEMDRLEPGIGGIGAVFSSNTAVFDPFLYTIRLCEAAMRNGASFFMDTELSAVRKEGGVFILQTSGEDYRCEILVNSAGLYADRVSAMAGDGSFTIYPCRGEYFVLDTAAAELISRPVYPVPRKGVGGLGVHLTTTVDGNVLIGPSAEYIEDREDYATSGGMMDELFREAKTLLPALERDMIIGAYTGIRPKLVPKGQANYGDFVIGESPRVENLVNLIGIESPGLTASVPIAEMVAEIIGRKRSLGANPAYQAEYRGSRPFAELDSGIQNALIAGDPDYGEVICRCKNLTRAEVLRALRNPLGVRSIVAVKNRLHATMGRCQGGYCLAKIANIIMEEFRIAPEDIVYRYQGDSPFPGAVK